MTKTNCLHRRELRILTAEGAPKKYPGELFQGFSQGAIGLSKTICRNQGSNGRHYRKLEPKLMAPENKHSMHAPGYPWRTSAPFYKHGKHHEESLEITELWKN